jgi:hypothetical protein
LQLPHGRNTYVLLPLSSARRPWVDLPAVAQVYNTRQVLSAGATIQEFAAVFCLFVCLFVVRGMSTDCFD